MPRDYLLLLAEGRPGLPPPGLSKSIETSDSAKVWKVTEQPSAVDVSEISSEIAWLFSCTSVSTPARCARVHGACIVWMVQCPLALQLEGIQSKPDSPDALKYPHKI